MLTLGLPFVGPGARLAFATSGYANTAIQLSRVGVEASAIWGYLSTALHLAKMDAPDIGGSGGGSSAGSGKWVKVNEEMSDGARWYQAQITGRPDEVYLLNGVKFDGFDGVRLLDAKWRYSQFMKNGQSQEWFRATGGVDDWRRIAENQYRAAKGRPIQWHFAEKEVADAVRPLVDDFGIEIIHTPAAF